MSMSKPIGIANQGNTCYINASLECLRFMPEFRNYLNEEDFGKNLKLTKSLGNFFKELDEKKNWKKYLSEVLTIIYEPKYFKKGKQHDSDALLEYLFEVLEKESSGFSTQNTKIKDLFTGYKAIEASCSSCNAQSRNQSPFHVFNIFPVKNKPLSEYFTSSEKNLRCQSCKNNSLVKTITLTKAPIYLFVCLDKESDFQSNVIQPTLQIKTPSNTVNLFEIIKELLFKFDYGLVSQILYRGNLESGHYTAVCNVPEMKETFLFNDSYAEKSKFSNKNDVYIGVYKRNLIDYKFWVKDSPLHEKFLEYLGNFEIYLEIVQWRFWAFGSPMNAMFLNYLKNLIWE